jgi:hypothetical protein
MTPIRIFVYLFALLQTTSFRCVQADNSPPAAANWTKDELQCLLDMEEADATSDHMLSHREYFVFADVTANRMFDMVNALDEENEWELDELYEILVLFNPSNQMNGIDILGAAYGTLSVIHEAQANFLKRVCHDTVDALRAIGPDL